MHIEPALVDTTKIFLSYATATAALGYMTKLAWDMVRQEGIAALLARSVITALLVFAFFEVLPTHPVGVSEVHLILGSTLLLVFGAAPAAIGLAAGLAVQSLFFAPDDLPQYGMNVTTLLVPLFAIQALARRVIAPATPYVDIRYAQALKLSVAYQGGIVVWVGFWALYGQGFAAENIEDAFPLPDVLMHGKEPTEVYMLRVDGESMRDAGIRDGDILVVNHNCNCVNGDIVVARVHGESATVKRFFREKDRVRLQPENDLFDPIYVPFDEVEISGKVIGLLRSI